MSSGNVELVQRIRDVFNRRDIDAHLAMCDPEIEYWTVASAATGEPYVGHAGVRAYFEELEEAWEEFRLVFDEVQAIDDRRVLVLGAIETVGRASRVPTRSSTGWVFEVQNGVIRRMRVYVDQEEARRASSSPPTRPGPG